MKIRSRNWFWFLLFSLLIIGLMVLAGFFIRMSLLPENYWGGDFFVFWKSLWSFAKEGVNPYASFVQRDGVDIRFFPSVKFENGLKFSSPLYSIFIILPLVVSNDFQIAFTIWLVLLFLIQLFCLWLSLRITGWKPPLFLFLLLFAFTFLGFHNFISLAVGSVMIVVMVFLYLALEAIRQKRNELAGILLALATIEPRAIIFVILFVLFWSAAKRLWTIVVWYFATTVILSILGVFLIPDWPISYLRVLFNFKDNFEIINPVNAFSSSLPGIGRQLGWGVSLLMVVILILEWLAARKKDFNWFLWTICLTMVVSQWVGTPVDPDDFVLLILPFVLVLSMWEGRFARFGKWMAGISLVGLLFGQWMIFADFFPEATSLTRYQNFIFPLPFFLLIGLYWVRWWAVRSQRDYIEGLKSIEDY